MFSHFPSLFFLNAICGCGRACVCVRVLVRGEDQIPTIDSNHLIKTKEFIGNDLHKVHIKSVYSFSHHITSHSWHSFIHIQKNHGCWTWTTMKIGTAYRMAQRSYKKREKKKQQCLHLLFHTVHSLVQLHRTNGKMCATEMGKGIKQTGKFTFFFYFNVKSNICVQFGQRKRSMHTKSVFNMQNHFDGTHNQTTMTQKKRWIIEARIELLALSRTKTTTNGKSVEFLCTFFVWYECYIFSFTDDGHFKRHGQSRIAPDMTEKKHTDA